MLMRRIALYVALFSPECMTICLFPATLVTIMLNVSCFLNGRTSTWGNLVGLPSYRVREHASLGTRARSSSRTEGPNFSLFFSCPDDRNLLFGAK